MAVTRPGSLIEGAFAAALLGHSMRSPATVKSVRVHAVDGRYLQVIMPMHVARQKAKFVVSGQFDWRVLHRAVLSELVSKGAGRVFSVLTAGSYHHGI